MNTFGKLAVAFIAGVSICGAGVSLADSTSILKTGEISHLNVFNGAYGGGFTQSGLDFTNGAITATRVDDSLDQLFGAGTFSAEAIGRFARLTQSFGIITSSGYTSLIDVVGSGFNVTGAVSDVTVDSTFAFARTDSTTVSSVNADNTDGLDHMITYQLTGLNGQTTYVLFFEDLLVNSDRDFNDLIVQVTFADGGASSIPTPTAGLGGLLSLAVLGGFRYYRRTRG